MTSPYDIPNAELESAGGMRPCVGCGKELHVTAATCPHCGASQRSKRYKSKVTAAVLAFFLGGFGIHRFYLGQWWGVIYLLLFWTFNPGIVAFIEFIVFLACNEKGWDQKYNEGIPAGPNDKSSAALVVLLVIVGVFIFIAIIGILAAIAIPQYADYTQRAKVAQAFAEIPPVQQRIVEFYEQHDVLPDSNIMAGLDEPLLLEGNHEIRISGQGFELILSSNNYDIDGTTIVFEPYLDEAGNIFWVCTEGDLEHRLRPADCRP